jgi:4-diphosphocytidyl-2-C-methyl-D-erythritol kinase
VERALALESPAKINLFLEVLDRRPDGYHEIDTLFQTVSLADRVEVEVTPGRPGIAVATDDPALPRDEENLAGRAARALLDEAGRADIGVRVRIAKRIPSGAGLGGGSGDAATVLVALDRLLELAWGADRLEAIGARIGSDVPFLVRGGTARGRGRGEILSRLPPLEAAPILLAKPPVSVSTGWAYANLRRRLTPRKPFPKIAAADASLRVSELKDSMWNAFVESVASVHPSVREARETMLGRGALAASLTGTGPTVFGIFPDESTLGDAERELASRAYWSARVVPVGERPPCS